MGLKSEAGKSQFTERNAEVDANERVGMGKEFEQKERVKI